MVFGPKFRKRGDFSGGMRVRVSLVTKPHCQTSQVFSGNDDDDDDV